MTEQRTEQREAQLKFYVGSFIVYGDRGACRYRYLLPVSVIHHGHHGWQQRL